MRKPYQSIRIFKSDLLERCTHVHPITPLLVWIPIISLLLQRSYSALALNLGLIAAWAALGLFVWTLSEYLLHRFVFHFPANSAFSKRFVFIMHGLHHDDPNDPTRLVMPPVAGLLIAAVLFVFFRFFLGTTAVVPFFAGFLIGYLIYDYTHYAVHHFTPHTRVGRYLKQAHMLHHFVNHDKMWGVSSPLWDLVFGTYLVTKRSQRVVVSE